MREQVFRYGEFIIVLKGDIATVYDRRTRMKVFKGELEQVIHELREKIEGSLNFNFDFEPKGKKKKRGMWSWEF